MYPLWSMTIELLLDAQVSNIQRMELFTKFPILGRADFPNLLDTAASRLAGGDSSEARLLQAMAQWVQTEQTIAEKLMFDFGPGDHSLDDAANVELMLDRLANRVRNISRESLPHLVRRYDDLLFAARSVLKRADKLY